MEERHYKLRRDLSIEVNGKTLYRIEATKNIERLNVKVGDLGGYIQSDDNLSDNAWVYGEALVSKISDCRNIINNKYNITILPEHMKIGCQMHTRSEWFGFSDREIIAMDGKEGLKWWRTWKPILQAICETEE